MVTDQAYWPRVLRAVRQFSPPFAVCLGGNMFDNVEESPRLLLQAHRRLGEKNAGD